ncbi:hypothetical protein Xcc1_36750 [Xanthomonas campestris pv. campestris]|nr:hypothetical protein Xcc1_36750 [Xanthomonas campestris pv. campestris]
MVADGAEQLACAGYMRISSTGRARMAAAESFCWLLLIGRVIKPQCKWYVTTARFPKADVTAAPSP